ncbi:hypothetical protein BLOT_003076 [Blomia tropicalis]|nr:hypothetical protein BLOT_003076 [Blomia tropicalis]
MVPMYCFYAWFTKVAIATTTTSAQVAVEGENVNVTSLKTSEFLFVSFLKHYLITKLMGQ